MSYGSVAQTELSRALSAALASKSEYGPAHLGLNGKDMRGYSALRAVLNASAGNLNGTFEGDCSAEISKRLSIAPSEHGFFLPLDIQTRDMTSAGASGSNYLVGTANVSFLDLVRNRSVVSRMGATHLNNLTANATIPRISADSTAYWLTGEATQITESQPTIGQIGLSPKHAGAYSEISSLLKKQSPAAEAVLMATLAGTVGAAIDVGAIAGSGAGGQPTGIINTSGIGGFSGTSLGWAALADAQSDVMAGVEVDPAACGYATTAAVALTLMGRQRFTGTDSPVWQGTYGDGILAGCRALASGNVPTATAIFGYWPSLTIANWGVLQIETNPYAGFLSGVIGFRAMVACDIAVRRASDFSVASSIT